MRRALVRTRRVGNWLPSVVILTSVVAVALLGAAQERQLRLVSTAWSPFTNVAGQPRFALDLVETAFGRVGVKATTSLVEPAQFTSALLTGAFDGSGAAWKDAERERVLLFSEPYLENRLVLIGRRGADVSAAAFKSLAGKRVAIVGGYSYGDIQGTGPTFVQSQTEQDSLSLLLASKVDYMLMDELVVADIQTNYPEQAGSRLQIGTTPLLKRALYVAVRRSLPDAESLITRFNSQLRTMIVDGTYHRLLHVDWINADVDGDGRTELVAKNDKAGLAPPQRVYEISSAPAGAPRPPGAPQIYIGRTLYNNWTDVPDSYKASVSQKPSSDKSTLSTFTFTWK